MNRYILLSFVVMGFGYYELSGGADFVPETRLTLVADAETVEPGVVTDEPDLAGIEVVTRADTTTLDELPPAESDTAEAINLTLETLTDAVPASVEEAFAPQTASGTTDLREVTGDRVNMRDGPGTDYGVIDRLGQGSVIEVIEIGVDGWVRVQVESSGLSGWMSDQFLLPISG